MTMFIFDYDGVIVNSLDMCIDTINDMAVRYNFPGRVTKEMVGKLESVTMEAVFLKIGVPKKNYHLYGTELLGHFRENSLKAGIFDGIADIFRIIQESGNLATINTANDSSAVSKRLEQSGIREYISLIIGADTEGTKSEKIKTIMKKFNISPVDTYMIGDTMGDITEGRKAHAHTIAVTYGWQTREILETVSPDHFCNSVQNLKDYIHNLLF